MSLKLSSKQSPACLCILVAQEVVTCSQPQPRRCRPLPFPHTVQVVPWAILAYDLGQRLDDEQVREGGLGCYQLFLPSIYSAFCSVPLLPSHLTRCTAIGILPVQGWVPRLFKSHQALSAINRGGKYLCIVRRPDAVLKSWYNFLCAKGVPPVVAAEDINEFAKLPDFFTKNMRFGVDLWQYYREFWTCRGDPRCAEGRHARHGRYLSIRCWPISPPCRGPFLRALS